MFAKMTIGKRISIGFALVLFLAVSLGSMAIFEMRKISTLSEQLSNDYAPEVDIVGSIERNARRVMYDMRGYSFTEEDNFLKQAKSWRETLQKRLDSADQLAAKSKVLVKLAPMMKILKDEVAKYDSLMDSTKVHIDILAGQRDSMAKMSDIYIVASTSYLTQQNSAMESEFKDSSLSLSQRKERLAKITLMNDAIDIMNGIRVKNYKFQTLRDPQSYELAIKDFDKMVVIEEKLQAVTRNESDKQLLKQIIDAQNGYRNEMVSFLAEWKLLQQVGVDRTKVGVDLVKQAEELAKAGVAGTTAIANEAISTVNIANTVMLWGLVIVVLLGIALSYILVKAITTSIMKISNGLRDSSNQVSSASKQLSEASQELSSSSNEQAASIEETSSSLEEITGMVNNNVDNAKKCVEISQSVSESSKKGNSSMKELVESMRDILESNEKIQQLVKVIGEIGEKTAIIDEIVFQTKLLSFNASVEAERAGEHGRGFAVVAQEVGNLAQMSGKAATEISAIVKESIKNAEGITTDNKKKVENGNAVVKSAAEILREISERSASLLDNINSILSASQDQATGIGQINSAITQLDKATQENAATAEETASSSEELSAQAEILNNMVGELTKIVTGSVEVKTQMPTMTNYHNSTQGKKSNVVPLSRERKVLPANVHMSSSSGGEQNEWEAV